MMHDELIAIMATLLLGAGPLSTQITLADEDYTRAVSRARRLHAMILASK